MMTKKRRWLWVVLFVGVTLLLSGLATGWNIVLLLDYHYIISLAKNLSHSPIEPTHHSTSLMIRMILGTLGFIVTLALTILLFIKLLNEMRLNQLQSEFLATLSHELKTPIAALELSSTLIRAGGLSKSEINQLWSSHEKELRRLREEVEALLEAARWQSQSARVKLRPVRLEHWIQTSLEAWKAYLGSGAVIKREGDPLNFETHLDPKLMKLIIENLLSNSRKFAQGTPRIIIRTLSPEHLSKLSPQKKNIWQICFQDFGWGFDPNDSKKIFSRFVRSRNLAPYAIPGTGLGLYLAKSACKTMGLSLKAESQGHKKGAKFILEGKTATRSS